MTVEDKAKWPFVLVVAAAKVGADDGRGGAFLM